MTTIADRMTRGVRSLDADDSMMFAAQAMDELNVGSIPVCQDERLIGIVTDRDIVVRGVAQGLDGDTKLSELMSKGVQSCREDQAVEDAVRLMRANKIRRVPVVDADGRLVGIVALGDLSAEGDADAAGDALQDISTPSAPDRSGFSAAAGPAAGGSASGQPSRTPG